MLDKILYKATIIAPYVLLAISIALFIVGAVKKSNNKSYKKSFIMAAATLVLGIVLFFVPFIVIWMVYIR